MDLSHSISLKSKSPKQLKRKVKAFTLIELVLVMVILGVMSVGIAGFISMSSQVFVNVSERDEILSNARFVIERMNREVRNAVPNSTRILTTSSFQCIEFMPIKGSAFYTEIPVAPEPISKNFTVIDFVDRLGNSYQCPAGSCNDYVSVYPIDSSDIYVANLVSGVRTYPMSEYAPPVLPLVEGTVTIASPVLGAVFGAESPTSRAYFFDSPISYCVSGRIITRYDSYGIFSNQIRPQPGIGNASLMAEELLDYGIAAPPFVIVGATLERNALVQSTLIFERDGEEISFNNEIQILNTP